MEKAHGEEEGEEGRLRPPRARTGNTPRTPSTLPLTALLSQNSGCLPVLRIAVPNVLVHICRKEKHTP